MAVKLNRLVKEKSPYLLQHAKNPVDWYPWGEEAFSLSRKMEKPIFLSIGYSTCHWCHVMEKESFSNEEIGKVLNETFVCIKVDREELPEVDSLYMELAQILMNSSAGWPLNLILTPELKPFYAVTYLPAFNSSGMMGLKEVSLYVAELWGGAKREKVLFQAQELIDMFEETFSVFETSPTMPSPKLITHGAEAFFRAADFVYGGKKGAPKFPMSYHLDFLLEYGHLYEDSVAESYVDLTLDMMSRGGIYDHIGGGFSRYCVDEKWFVPHFEKMLSDNAMLSYSYLLGYKFLSKPEYKIISEEILDFLMREMLSNEDLFFSAQDADSDGKEGEFYTWSYQEIKESLTPFESEIFLEFYNVLEEGNFEGKNILFQHLSFEEFANLKQIPLDKIRPLIKQVREKLLAERGLKKAPLRDDKVITSWNAKAIKSFLFAGFTFSNPTYILIAKKSMASLLDKVYQEGRLYHRYKENEVKYQGNLEDYSSMIDLLFSFFEFGFGVKYLKLALKLLEDALTLFQSSEGGFYFSCDQGKALLFRRCEFNDGAEPASNSLFASALIKAFEITKINQYKEAVEGIFRAPFTVAAQYPLSFAEYLKVLMRYYNTKQILIVIALDEKESSKSLILDYLASCNHLHFSVIWKHLNESFEEFGMSFLSKMQPIEQTTTFYVCDKFKCYKPALTLEDLKKLISSL